MHPVDVGEAAAGEAAQHVERRRRLGIGLEHPARIGRPARLVEGKAVDDVAAVGGQLHSLHGLGRRRARLGELAGDAAHLHHRHLGAVGQHHRHLQQHLEGVAHGGGPELVEALGTIPALKKERLPPADGGEFPAQAPRLAGEDQRRVGAERRLRRRRALRRRYRRASGSARAPRQLEISVMLIGPPLLTDRAACYKRPPGAHANRICGAACGRSSVWCFGPPRPARPRGADARIARACFGPRPRPAPRHRRPALRVPPARPVQPAELRRRRRLPAPREPPVGPHALHLVADGRGRGDHDLLRRRRLPPRRRSGRAAAGGHDPRLRRRRRGPRGDQAGDRVAPPGGAPRRGHRRALHRRPRAGQGGPARRQACDDPLGEPGRLRRGVRRGRAHAPGLHHRRQPHDHRRRHRLHRPDAADHRPRPRRGPRQRRGRPDDLFLDPHRPGPAAPLHADADRRAPPQAVGR